MSIEFNDAISSLEDRAISGVHTDNQMTAVEEKTAVVGATIFEKERHSEHPLTSRDFCSLDTNIPKMSGLLPDPNLDGATAHIGTLELFSDKNSSPQKSVSFTDCLYDIDALKSLIAIGADLNAPDRDGDTPLILAMRWGDIDAIPLLLNAGADVSPIDHWGKAAIHYARDPEVAELLLNAGADPHVLADNGNTLLHVHAEYPQMVELWLRTGLNPDAKDSYGTTPLDIALRKNYAWSAELLLDGGATLSEEQLVQELYDAIERRNGNIVGMLLAFEQDRKGLRDAAEKEAVALLNAAISSRQPKVVKQLLDAGIDPNGDAFLGRSFWYSSCEETALLLIEAGADPNVADKEGILPLHGALWSGFNKAAALLLEKGADPNKADAPFGSTPLIIAIGNEAMEIVDLLLDLGADLNLREIDGDSPLSRMLWMRNMKDPSDIKRFARMLELGADPNWRVDLERTPLMNAIKYGQKSVIPLLLEAGANPCFGDKDCNTPLSLAERSEDKEIIQMIKDQLPQEYKLIHAISNEDIDSIKALIANGVDLNAPDQWGHFSQQIGETPLMIATRLDNIEIVQLLLSAGANVNILARSGASVLHRSKTPETLEFLLKAGANPNVLIDDCYYGKENTLLHLDTRFPQMIDLWLRAGVNSNAKNAAGHTPLDIALRNQDLWSVELLLDAGATLSEEQFACALQSAKERRNNNMLSALLVYEQEQKGLANTAEKEAKALLNTAISTHKPEEVKRLLNAGANPNSDTFLSRSFWYRSCEEISLLLIEAGADPNAVNRNGEYPLHEAIRLGFEKAAVLLLEKGADPNKAVGPHFYLPNSVRDDATPLFTAIEKDLMNIVDFLLDAGGDVNPPGIFHAEAPLSVMLRMSDWEDPSTIKRFARMLELGANPNWVSTVRQSLLTSAIEYDRKSAIPLLLKAGADPELSGWGRSAPLVLAKDKGNPEIIQMIEEALSKKVEASLLQSR